MSKKKRAFARKQKSSQHSGRRQSFFARATSGLFYYVINSAAYSLRIFLRIRLGERAIGFPTVLLSFVWVCYFLTDDYAISFDFGASLAALEEGLEIYSFLIPIIIVLNFIGQFLVQIFGAFVNAAYQLRLTVPDSVIGYSDTISWYSYIVLVLGIVHIAKIRLRATSKIHVHSYARGKSAFFWWLEGRSAPWLRGDRQTGEFIGTSVKITERTIFTYVEPTVVVLFGFFLNIYGQDHIGWYCIISALALTWDEHRESAHFKGQVLDMLDGELDGQDLIEEYKKIKGEAVGGGNFERGARIPG